MATELTKGEKRKARKAGTLRDYTVPRDDAHDTQVYTETAKGQRALARWARRYDALNGAPESPEDY